MAMTWVRCNWNAARLEPSNAAVTANAWGCMIISRAALERATNAPVRRVFTPRNSSGPVAVSATYGTDLFGEAGPQRRRRHIVEHHHPVTSEHVGYCSGVSVSRKMDHSHGAGLYSPTSAQRAGPQSGSPMQR